MVLFIRAQGRGNGDIPHDRFDASFGEGLSRDSVPAFRRLIWRQQLYGPHAVTADGAQQVKGIRRSGLEACSDAATDLRVVGEEIVEIIVYGITAYFPVCGDGER